MQKCAKFFAKTNLLQSFIFKQDLWTPQLHFQSYFQGLYVFSINFKKIENSLRFGVRPQPQPQTHPQPQRFCCGNRNRKAGYAVTARRGMGHWDNFLFLTKRERAYQSISLQITPPLKVVKDTPPPCFSGAERRKNFLLRKSFRKNFFGWLKDNPPVFFQKSAERGGVICSDILWYGIVNRATYPSY